MDTLGGEILVAVLGVADGAVNRAIEASDLQSAASAKICSLVALMI
jgi:hypothetical protein